MGRNPMALVVLLLALLLARPTTSAAEQLVLGFDTQTGWNDNLGFSDTDQEDVFPYRFSPWLELRRRRGDLNYDLRYRVTYEDYFDRSDADTIDQLLRLRGTYRVSETTGITFSEQFAREQSLTQRLEEVEPEAGEVPDLENRRRRFVRNAASVGLTHILSRRWTMSGEVSNTLVDFRDDEFVDSSSLSGNGSLNHALSARDRVGFGLSATHQDFEETDLRPSSQADYLSLFGSWIHEFSPNLTMAVQAGPTWIRTDTDGPGGSQSRFTYFGNGSLSKRWETVNASLRYKRTESTSSGVSGGTVADTVGGRITWKPSLRWNFELNASWTRRESATEQIAVQRVAAPSPPFPPGSFFLIPRQIDTDDSVDQWNLRLRVDRRVTRHLSVFGRVSWTTQESSVEALASSSRQVDRFQAFLGLRWQTTPFLF